MSKKEKGNSNGEATNGTHSPLPLLKSVYEFMTQNNLDAVEIDENALHLKLVRRKTVQPMQVPVPVMMTGAGNVPSSAASSVPPPSSGLPPGSVTIKSSMMGIFYRAPSPSSPPFVKEGEAVKAGQVLCMIEAMKVFNEIKAEYPCTLVRTLLENGKPVKSGQDLFVVQRA